MVHDTTAPGRVATAAYAAGSFGTGVFSTVPTILLLYFCTEILRLPPQWATAIVFVPKIWSILWDPFVGAWSDRTVSILGRRRPFLLAGTVGVALAFVAVFSPPVVGRSSLALWVAIAYLLLTTVYSLFAVPYVAIPAELGRDGDIRARLTSWRMFVAMLGVLTGAGLVPLLVQSYGGGRDGYAAMSIRVALACALAMAAPIFMLRGRDPRLATRAAGPSSQWHDVWSALADAQFVTLLCAYLLQLTAIGMISATTPYLVTKCLGREETSIGTAMFAMFAVTALTIPLWSLAGRRWGETRMLVAGATVYVASAMALGALTLAHASWHAVLGAYALLGGAIAAMQVLPYTLVAHLIHREGERGRRAEASLMGVWTATEKLGLALGPAATGLVLWLSAGIVTTSLPTLTLVGPAFLTLMSLVLLRFVAARSLTPASLA